MGVDEISLALHYYINVQLDPDNQFLLMIGTDTSTKMFNKVLICACFFVCASYAQSLYDDGFRTLDPISARRFQEANGLPENPNSVFPAQSLVRPVLRAMPANRPYTPIVEDEHGNQYEVPMWMMQILARQHRFGGFPRYF